MSFAERCLFAVANLTAACSAFVILAIYFTFVLWGAAGWLFTGELALIAVGVLTLLICSALSWRKRPLRTLKLASLASSIVVLIFAALVFFSTIISRRGTSGFTKNMLWLSLPMAFLTLNAVLEYASFAKTIEVSR
jgi:multisubunit Na+/H+ antiporter MnhB subunit